MVIVMKTAMCWKLKMRLDETTSERETFCDFWFQGWWPSWWHALVQVHSQLILSAFCTSSVWLTKAICHHHIHENEISWGKIEFFANIWTRHRAHVNWQNNIAHLTNPCGVWCYATEIFMHTIHICCGVAVTGCCLQRQMSKLTWIPAVSPPSNGSNLRKFLALNCDACMRKFELVEVDLWLLVRLLSIRKC